MMSLSQRFNLLSSGTKRAADASAANRSAKLPKASEISIEAGAKPTQTPRRLPANAPVDVCVIRYTDRASDIWDRFKDNEDAPLYQIQIQHNSQRAITYQLRDAWQEFLRQAHKEDSAMPASLQELEVLAGIRLIVTDRQDPDDVGFVQWRCAFYGPDHANFMRLLDGWFRYKARQAARDQPFSVVLHPGPGVDLQPIWEELEYEHYEMKEPSSTLPMHALHAQPVVGKKIVMLNLQLDEGDKMSLIVTGYTWPFRNRLDTFGVSGGYVGEEKEGDNTARKYFRVWKDIDLSDETQQEKFLTMISDVFKNLAMRISYDHPPKPDTHAARFIDVLRKQPALHFTAECQTESTADSTKPGEEEDDVGADTQPM